MKSVSFSPHLRPLALQKRNKDKQSGEVHRGQMEQKDIEDYLPYLLAAEKNDVSEMECVGQKDGSTPRSTSNVLYNIHDLLETRLRSDSQRRHQREKDQQMMSEWMIAAAVIDRICFILFSLIFVIGTAVLFILATSK